MKLGITILKDENRLDDLLHKFKANDLKNITIINSNSKVSNFNDHKNRIYGSLRTFFDYYNDESRIILNIINDNEIENLKNILKDTLQLNQYSFFTIEINDVEGNIWWKFF